MSAHNLEPGDTICSNGEAFTYEGMNPDGTMCVRDENGFWTDLPFPAVEQS